MNLCESENVHPSTVFDDWHYAHQGKDWEHCFNEQVGRFQSPINIPIKELTSQIELIDELEYFYDGIPEAYSIEHKMNRSIKVTSTNSKFKADRIVIPMGHVIVDGKVFTVNEFHFHSPAEHLLDGNRYSLEFHIVHKFDGYETSSSSPSRTTQISRDYSIDHENEIVVVAILFSSRPNASSFSFLDDFLKIEDFPFKPGAQTIIELSPEIGHQRPHRPRFDLTSLLLTEDQTTGSTFARYFGSLTTPPLHEVVHWFVRCTPVYANPSQLTAFASALRYPGSNGNYRSCDGRCGLPRHVLKDEKCDSSDSSFIREKDGQQYVWLVKGLCGKKHN